MANNKWSLDLINDGIELFISTHNRMPTARDFDDVEYLPSARQIQRNYNGLPALREALGYGKLDFTRGELRTTISRQASIDGISAEEYLEPLLVAKFGEPFVHTQKRYGTATKHRYDFFIYAHRSYFGVDVFNTKRSEYIATNVRHKMSKYRSVSAPIVFVALGNEFSAEEIERAKASIHEMKQTLHMNIMNETQFLSHIEGMRALNLPDDYKGLLS